MIFPSVFVQIPNQNTTLAPAAAPPPPKVNASVRRQDEIKAEPPIKSEIDNNNQAQSLIGGGGGGGVVGVRLNKDGSRSTISPNTQSALTANLVTARPKVKCFKCEQCPFMSISQNGYNMHIETAHNTQNADNSANNRKIREKILCPGCENVFYSKMSLEIHLVNDHQMSRSDISQLLESLLSKKTNASNDDVSTTSSNPDEPNVEKPMSSEASTERRRVQSQKIYLKNVEVLLNSDIAGEFGVQETPSTIPTPIENPSLSNSTDDLTINDTSSGCRNFNLITFQSHQSNNNNNNNNNDCSYESQSDDFTGKSQIISSTSGHERVMNRNLSPLIEITSIDDITKRPDSGNSIKFSDNFVDSCNSWQPTSVANFSSYQTVSSSSSPVMIPVCQNEKKKIYIKNIDILKEPIQMADSTYRRSTLHLRTVDEVNLLINRQHDSTNFPENETITLSEDDYRYVLNDTADYQNLIPQYLENDVGDSFDIFPNDESIGVTNATNEYFNNVANINNSNYSIMNLEPNGIDDGSNNLISFDSSMELNATQQSNHDRSAMNQLSAYGTIRHMSNSDSFAIVHGSTTDNIDGSHFFANKFLPMKSIDNSIEQCMLDQCVSSEAIIDILDLTNDEVEQILDDNNLIGQGLDSFQYADSSGDGSKMLNTMASMGKIGSMMVDDCIWLDPLAVEPRPSRDGKAIDVRSLEPPTIDLDPITVVETVTKHTEHMPSMKKRSGRTKGARQKNREKVSMIKCSVANCGMRFATETAILLHKQCHSAGGDEIQCPKCENDVSGVTTTTPTTAAMAKKNWNWNTLHTHLWREHNIDMELYGCPHCSFKTPILSRLRNTHMRIHSDSKDFKCDWPECLKSFKNARQMKNHRRIHTKSAPPTISQCKYCGQSFLSAKHLKEHYFTHSEAIECQASALQCDRCSEIFGSKHALRIHHLSHLNDKRFNCSYCDYKSNDHNAYRRHQMVHSKQMKYKCPCCPFECIQSTNYRNHVLKKHPDSARELMFMCDKCNFVTVNKRMYEMHCLNLNHNNQLMPSVELE